MHIHEPNCVYGLNYSSIVQFIVYDLLNAGTIYRFVHAGTIYCVKFGNNPPHTRSSGANLTRATNQLDAVMVPKRLFE